MIKKIILICFVALIPTAYSQAQTLVDELAKCTQIDNSLKRLICFDDLAQKLTGNTAFKEAKNNVKTNPVVPAAPVAQASDDDYFGKEQTKVAEMSTEDKIYATVTEINKNARKKSIFTLSNGQEWLHVDESRLRLKIGERVYVERGMLGAFYMGKDSENRRIKVKRVD